MPFTEPRPASASARIAEEQNQRRGRRAELVHQGWKSTGDLPYQLAEDLNRPSGFFESSTRKCVDEVVSIEGEEYKQAHLEKLGKQTFISLDLISKVRARFISHYGIPPRKHP